MKKRSLFLSLFAALMALCMTFQSCGTINKAEKGTALGAAAGGAIGAMVGKKAGNPAIGATIGAAFGGSTAAFIASKLTRSPEDINRKTKPLYVINGTPCKVKEAEMLLNEIKADEIESVTVLSNTEAIAQFGNKGSKGAIVITFRNTNKS
ncbi:MAG: OmpA family protein [Sphingobacteriaceae bacterium]|nr:OmpA family protein [Sphingobacteriaceae bacterium]